MTSQAYEIEIWGQDEGEAIDTRETGNIYFDFNEAMGWVEDLANTYPSPDYIITVYKVKYYPDKDEIREYEVWSSRHELGHRLATRLKARESTKAKKTRLDMLLDKVRRGEHEVTIDTDGYTAAQIARILATAEARGLHAAYTGRWILIRDFR